MKPQTIIARALKQAHGQTTTAKRNVRHVFKFFYRGIVIHSVLAYTEQNALRQLQEVRGILLSANSIANRIRTGGYVAIILAEPKQANENN